jgi:hypothetical protein
MVVTGIFMILSSVVLATNSRFGNLIILQNLASDMALSVRQAQVYGIAVRRYQGTNFDVSYGMHFTLPAPNTASIYQLFADVNRNGVYDGGDSIVEATTIKGGYSITALCARTVGSSVDDCTVSTLDIVFRRPEPDACVSVGGVATFSSKFICVSNYDKASVRVDSNRGQHATVVVEMSGQISAQ